MKNDDGIIYPEDIDGAFGARLERCTNAAGLTRAELAPIIGVSTDKVDAYMSGELPIPDVLENILQVLGLSIGELLVGKKDDYSLEKIASRFTKKFAGKFKHTYRVVENLFSRIDQLWNDDMWKKDPLIKLFFTVVLIAAFGLLVSIISFPLKSEAFRAGWFSCSGMLIVSSLLFFFRLNWLFHPKKTIFNGFSNLDFFAKLSIVLIIFTLGMSMLEPALPRTAYLLIIYGCINAALISVLLFFWRSIFRGNLINFLRDLKKSIGNIRLSSR